MIDSPLPRLQGLKRQIPRHLGLVPFLLDACAIWLAFHTTKHLSGLMVYLSDEFGWSYDFHHFDTRRYYYIFMCALVLFRFVIKGHYSRRLPWLGQMENIITTFVMAALFDAFNYFLLDYTSLPFWLLFNWSLCLLYVLIARQIAITLVCCSKDWPLSLVLVGDGRMVSDCLHAFKNEKFTGYQVKTILLTKSEECLVVQPSKIFNSIEYFPDYIRRNPNHYYIFGMEELCGEYANELMSAIEQSQIEYGVVPNTRALDVYGMEPHYFFGNDVMVLHRRDFIRSPSGRIVKRLLDIAASGMLLVPLGIFTAFVWAMKKVQKSKSPVFYGGNRIGRNGKPFYCWKFCTMRPDADSALESILMHDEEAREEWSKYQKLRNDPRIDSNISYHLRRLSLDELPQIWNVFKGDMSLVGPRPILEFQREDYGDKFEEYCAVRPGITGLWQVSGRNETTFEQRIYWDGWYIRNWSLWYDVVIIFKTVRVLINGTGAY